MVVGKAVVFVFLLVATAIVLSADQPKKAPQAKSTAQLSVKQARSRARLLHDVFTDTLDVIHRDYFKAGGGRKVVPSKALESVFRRQKRRWKVDARWLAVNADAMHIDHRAKDKFEKAAVRALARGKRDFEEVSKGRYRRAASIPLFESCLKCHLVLRTGKPRRRVAALVISLPVK